MWSIEPEPAPRGAVRYALPLRVVERDARTLAVTAALSWGDDYVEPFSLALPPTRGAVWRLGPGDYLIQQDSPGRVEWIVREAFP